MFSRVWKYSTVQEASYHKFLTLHFWRCLFLLQLYVISNYRYSSGDWHSWLNVTWHIMHQSRFWRLTISDRNIYFDVIIFTNSERRQNKMYVRMTGLKVYGMLKQTRDTPGGGRGVQNQTEKKTNKHKLWQVLPKIMKLQLPRSMKVDVSLDRMFNLIKYQLGKVVVTNSECSLHNSVTIVLVQFWHALLRSPENFSGPFLRFRKAFLQPFDFCLIFSGIFEGFVAWV